LAGLVRLRVFADLAEAQVAKSMLEAHDIPVYLFDEHFGGQLSPVVNLFGVQLMVQEERLDEASQLLEAKSDAPE